MSSTGDRWFKIVTLIGAGFGAGFSIANAIYYNRIRTGTCNAVTRGEATTLMWINIVLAIIFVIIFFWALWLLIFSSQTRTDISRQAQNFASGTTDGLIAPAPVIQPQPTSVGLSPGQVVTTSGSAAANILPVSVIQNPAQF